MMVRLRSLVAGAACALIALCAACELDNPCDPGHRLEHGACYPPKRATPGGAKPDAGAASADAGAVDGDGGDEPRADASAPAGDPYEGFGEACAMTADCAKGLICGAPMLALCTRTNCIDDPDACPSDWTCLDVTGLSPDPSVTSICLML